MFKKVFLFGLVTIIISVIMVFAYEDKFPRVAYKPPYDLTNPNHYYYQYFHQADSLGFTVLIYDNLIPFKTEDFSAAQTDSLNLVNGIEWYASGQYSMYQADRHNEPDYFQPPDPSNQIRFLSTRLDQDNVGHGRQYGDSTANNRYAWYVSKDSANDNRGCVLYGLWHDPNGIDYSREQDRDSGRVYNVIFKLKVPSVYVNDTVANLEVHFYNRGTTDSILAQRLLLYQDFRDSTGKYNSYKLIFGRPPYNERDSFDYRVYWYKQTDLYIDYVEVYDSNYAYLFYVPSGYNDGLTLYEHQLINDQSLKDAEQFHNSSLYRWYLQDEPNYDQFRSSRRVSYLLDSLHYAPGIQAVYYLNHYRYLNELDPYPKELFYDDYPIYSLPEEDSVQLQERLDGLAERFFKVSDAAKSKGKEWWYIAHTFKGNCTPPEICRYPHNSELRATVYMALAYGAKGIGYYRYVSSNTIADYDFQGGIVDTLGGHVQTYPYPENAYYSYLKPETLFNEVKQINAELDTLGPILKKLEWKWAGPSDSAGVDADPSSFIFSIGGDSCKFCGYVCKYPIYQNYIQVGKFKDDSLGEDYLMLVNRWVGYDDKPCERVIPHRNRVSYLYDCLTGQLLDTLSIVDTFHVLLFPGEVKLFRFANFLPSNLSVTRQGNPQRFNLNWTDPNTGESGYKIERKSASEVSWSVIRTTGPNVTTHQDSINLLGSETYYYRVRAFDQQYFSEYSNIGAVKNFPNSPRNLTAHLTRICCPGRGYGMNSGIGINGICPYCWTNEVILSWQQPDNQKTNSLRYYRAKARRGSWSAYQTVSSAYNSMVFCVPLSSAPDTFVVYAIDYSGDSSLFSNTVSITPGTTDNCGGGGGGEPQAKIAAQVIPEKFELFQNYPNPSNPGTLIKYALPQESNVKLVIYNILGQKVRVLVEDLQEPGYYTISWNGKNEQGSTVGSGIYFYHIQAGDFTKTAKMSLLK